VPSQNYWCKNFWVSLYKCLMCCDLKILKNAK
jgi:hypothetical protein